MRSAFASVLWAFVFGAWLSAAGAAELSIPEKAAPPLWVVEKDGKTLYLFGSIHLLPPQTDWSREEIAQAWAASKVFVFEAPLDDGGSEMLRFVETGGRLPDGQTLEDILPAKLHEDMSKAAWSVQYPPKLLEPLRPWLASVYLELYAYIKAGFSSYYGVDHVVEQEAKDRDAELAYFETVPEQLSYFAALDRKTETAYLKSTVKGVLEQPDLPLELLAAWASGETGALSKLIDEGFAEVPRLRSVLLVTRNRKWLPRLQEMVASDKTHFVTVGVGHLVGRDGLVAMLRARGYKVTGP
jgi:uncharacterized protein YbaP (TraB family)